MKNKTYEDAMEELKELGDALESGELSLEEALATYAKAVELIKFCNEKLQGTKKKMTVLVEELSGSIKEVPFVEEDYRG